ncbi:hypothetical protein CDL15_Pgr006508 [Punica granatum]|uniref:Uncharacterized protein n=1 Tax=Punica granatum TaxID=22663 RepID=A0A218XYQ3_PUNGR|nr:hypothetical protein CDL15_Pgr006508 [Punica granatum]
MIQLEDPSHGLEEESQDDRVGHEGELWDKHVPARASTRERAKRIQRVIQGLLLHVHGGVVKLLGGLDGRNATLLPLPPNQMDEKQLQIKHSFGEKSEEFKNVFLEEMPLEQLPIKSVVIDSRTNPFEERGNDMIQLEDPSHGLEEESQDDRVRHEGELWDKHVPARTSTRARAKRIQRAMQGLLLHVHGEVVKLLGRLYVELEATTIHILEIYLEDDPSSNG